jgi:hypothetical protein
VEAVQEHASDLILGDNNLEEFIMRNKKENMGKIISGVAIVLGLLVIILVLYKIISG